MRSATWVRTLRRHHSSRRCVTPTSSQRVVVSVVDARHRRAAEELLRAAHRERPTLPIIAGGYAVPDERSAVELGAAGWALDPRELAGLIESLGPG